MPSSSSQQALQIQESQAKMVTEKGIIQRIHSFRQVLGSDYVSAIVPGAQNVTMNKIILSFEFHKL